MFSSVSCGNFLYFLMKINIICIGKTEESYLREGIQKFLKRVSFYADVKFFELKPEKSRDLAEKIKKVTRGYKILLDVGGKELSSEQFAALIQEKMNQGCPEIDFLIGGHSGFPLPVKEVADLSISLSRCTFTHQMIRLLLLEQIYRAFTILQGHPYHK
ncbi:MAG: 23S rRNA (pseudouridine(1915)-N(3))-methyltransferase RlmH [bacterium]